METRNEYKVKIDREQIAINDIQSEVQMLLDCHPSLTNHQKFLSFFHFGRPDFLNFQIDALSKQVDDWTERYAKEAKELDVEIGQVNDAIQDVKSKYEDVTGRYDARQIDIDEYREEQRVLEEKRKFEEKQCKSAIRIQVKIFHAKQIELEQKNRTYSLAVLSQRIF